jgi:hypothetical protein
LIRENLNVVLALVDALVASPNGRLTGGRRGDRKRDRCERHLTFEVGRRADWAGVLENAAILPLGWKARSKRGPVPLVAVGPKADMAQQVSV